MEAYAQTIVTDEKTWLSMIEMRNRTSHTYDDAEISELPGKLTQYQMAFIALKGVIEKDLLGN